MTITNNNKAASPGESFEIVQTPIPKEFELLHRFWQASNYLSVGQIYLLNKNPLLRRPLTLSDVKTRLLGHFGTTPGQNFIYTHLNRIIREREVSMIYISGPGHGGPALVSQVYMEGTYTEYYPDITEDAEGMGKLFQQFSFPGGIPSHVAPETPGSMHEGGELGYCLSHAFGAVLDQPDLVVACVVGDGEAETGPLATSWHGNKFLNPKTDGVVLPILHLNGFKIANPTLLDRIPEAELKALFVGYGYEPIIVEGSDPGLVHPAMAKALDYCFDKISAIKKLAAVTEQGKHERPAWPMIIMRTPKGWTGPKFVDGQMIEGSYRSHQVPMSSPAENPEHLTNLVEWLMSYNSENLFDHDGRLLPELKALVPPKHLRMGNHPLTNPILRPLILPDFEPYGVDVTPSSRGTKMASDTGVFGVWLRDVVQQNEKTRNFRIFGPDETASNRLQAVFEVTNKQWMAEINQYDDTLAQEGRVMEMLSEHQCEGWLEGYLLTGRHGLLSSYEAFIHIITSMVNQHQKWYKMCLEIPWRNRLPSLNILLSSHVWRQDHNGFTHQDPGFIGHIATKRPEIVRIYLPPDANCLLSVMHHCLSSRHYINVVTAGKHPAPQWLTVEEARQHCERGISIWKWASNDEGCMPDVVMACAGDVPTLEALAAVTILRRRLPTLKVRFVNVVDLMRMNRPDEHPHGMNDEVFDSIFTKTQPVIFAFHAYIHLVEKLIAKRHNRKFLVKGYKEEGTISTAFDMTVMNELDRFHLVMDVCDAIESNCGSIDSKARWTAAYVRQEMQDLLTKHKKYIHEFGVDMDEITQWKWEVPEDGN